MPTPRTRQSKPRTPLGCPTGSRQQVTFNFESYSTRRETFEGREYLVVPVVMMVEGVHHGSAGPMLYTAEELAKFPGAWDGRPVPIFHPEQDGYQISCNQPDVLEQQTVGWLFNTSFNGGKLRSEAWIDVEKCERVSSATLLALRNGHPMDVSTGLWSEDMEVQGTWNGEHYTSIAQHIRPDHLALLPGGQGACGWADGCGVRANQRKEEQMVRDGNGSASNSWLRRLAASMGFASHEKPAPESRMVENAMSYQDISRSLQRLVDSWDGQGKVHFVKAVYDDYFVYEIAAESESQSGLFRQDYSINEESGEVTLSGENQRVIEQRDFVAVNADEENASAAEADEAGDNPENVHHNKEESEMKVNKQIQAMVDGLIKNEATPFTENDEEHLKGFSECVLKALSERYAASEESEGTVGTEGTGNEASEAPTASKDTEDTSGKDPQAPVASADAEGTVTMKVDDLQKLVDNAVSQRLENDQKAEIIEQLKANKCDIEDTALQGMNVPTLEKMLQLYQPDFSGRGTYRTQAGADFKDNAAPKMPGVVMAEESKTQ